MIYLFSFFIIVRFWFLRSFTFSIPIWLNVWFRVFTGIFVFLLRGEGLFISRISLYLIEESLSFFLIFIWIGFGGGILIAFILFIKGAFAPFHTWLIEVVGGASRQKLVWGLSFHKLPLLIVWWRFAFISASLFFLFRFLVGAILIITQGDIQSILILSSGNTIVRGFILFCVERSWAFFFFIGYIFALWRRFFAREANIGNIFLFFGLLGLPPFFFFQAKWILVEELQKIGMVSVSVFVGGSGVAVVAYIRSAWWVRGEKKRIPINLRFYTFWGVISCLIPAI